MGCPKFCSQNIVSYIDIGVTIGTAPKKHLKKTTRFIQHYFLFEKSIAQKQVIQYLLTRQYWIKIILKINL